MTTAVADAPEAVKAPVLPVPERASRKPCARYGDFVLVRNSPDDEKGEAFGQVIQVGYASATVAMYSVPTLRSEKPKIWFEFDVFHADHVRANRDKAFKLCFVPYMSVHDVVARLGNLESQCRNNDAAVKLLAEKLGKVIASK